MALHGEIKINGRTLWYWDVVRKGQVSGRDEPLAYRYEWTVLPKDERAAEFAGSLEHAYGDGAIELTTKVMQAAERERQNRLAAARAASEAPLIGLDRVRAAIEADRGGPAPTVAQGYA